MLSEITITCFATSYLVVLVLEISRLFFRSGIRGAMMLGFAGAGFFTHSVFLAYRANGAVGSPLSSVQDWYLVAAWILVIVYLYLIYYHPKAAFGLFVLPLVLGLIGVAAFVADTESFAREPASRVWGAIHGVSLLAATVAVLVGFVAGLMYLGQAYRLKHKKLPMQGFRLPSLEWLQRTNSRAITVAMLALGIGIVSGVILNLINTGRQVTLLPWNDPLILATLSMFGWLSIAKLIGIFYKPTREGRKVALITIVSFLFLLLALGIGLCFDTSHADRVESEKGDWLRRGSGIVAFWTVADGACPPFRTDPRDAPRKKGTGTSRQTFAQDVEICWARSQSPIFAPVAGGEGP